MKQEQLPLNNKSQNHDEENKKGLALEPCPPKGPVFDVEDHKDRGPCQEVLDSEEHERTLI